MFAGDKPHLPTTFRKENRGVVNPKQQRGLKKSLDWETGFLYWRQTGERGGGADIHDLKGPEKNRSSALNGRKKEG